MFRIRFTRTKKLPWKPKKDIGRTCLVYLGFHGSFVFVISPVTHGLFRIKDGTGAEPFIYTNDIIQR